jgi:hypothetical protein
MTVLFSQVLMTVPMLIVYVGGMILAGVWWRRATRPAMLAMAGLGLMLLSTLGSSLATVYLIQSRGPSSMAAMGQAIAIMNGCFMLLRAIGLGLLIAAVFAGRPRELGAFPMESNDQLPPLADLAPGQPPRA